MAPNFVFLRNFYKNVYNFVMLQVIIMKFDSYINLDISFSYIEFFSCHAHLSLRKKGVKLLNKFIHEEGVAVGVIRLLNYS